MVEPRDRRDQQPEDRGQHQCLGAPPLEVRVPEGDPGGGDQYHHEHEPGHESGPRDLAVHGARETGDDGGQALVERRGLGTDVRGVPQPLGPELPRARQGSPASRGPCRPAPSRAPYRGPAGGRWPGGAAGRRPVSASPRWRRRSARRPTGSGRAAGRPPSPPGPARGRSGPTSSRGRRGTRAAASHSARTTASGPAAVAPGPPAAPRRRLAGPTRRRRPGRRPPRRDRGARRAG